MLVRGALAGCSEEDQAKVRELAASLRELVADAGEHGLLALALVTAEMTAEIGE